MPVLLFELTTAVLVSIAWAFILLSVLSFKLARTHGNKPLNVIAEHLIIAILVIILTYWLGMLILGIFG